MKTPREVIASWLWNEADQIDFDDMGAEAGQQVIRALDAVGYVIVLKRDLDDLLAGRIPAQKC